VTVTRLLRAMVGLGSAPNDAQLAQALLLNGITETATIVAWVPPWVLSTAVLLIVGRAVHSSPASSKATILTIALIPVAISAVGVILHLFRAWYAVMGGRRLAVKKEAGGVYARLIYRLTRPSPWILVPQVALGALFAIAVAPKS
jgi:hypothetical protein